MTGRQVTGDCGALWELITRPTHLHFESNGGHERGSFFENNSEGNRLAGWLGNEMGERAHGRKFRSERLIYLA